MLAYRLPSETNANYFKGEWQTENRFNSNFLFSAFYEDHPSYGFFTTDQIKKNHFFQSLYHDFSSVEPPFCASKNQYLEYADKAIALINSGACKKVVLSKVKKVTVKRSPEEWFDSMCKLYPDAFVYIASGPFGLWAGASPEILFEVNNEAFKTVALAGTQVAREDQKYYWGDKEKEEQSMVVEYIDHVLTTRGLSYEKSQPYTSMAGSLVHLKTDFEGHFKKGQDWGELVKALHPTPAVCGLPQKTSAEFIKSLEMHQRTYYTGFLGPIEREKVSLFVNLRCMQIIHNEAFLYVGGGLTSDSDALLEWEETENKAKVLEKALS